jgi:hypothetical protein
MSVTLYVLDMLHIILLLHVMQHFSSQTSTFPIQGKNKILWPHSLWVQQFHVSCGIKIFMFANCDIYLNLLFNLCTHKKSQWLAHQHGQIHYCGQLHPAYSLTLYLYKINFNITIPSAPRLHNWFCPFRFWN